MGKGRGLIVKTRPPESCMGAGLFSVYPEKTILSVKTTIFPILVHELLLVYKRARTCQRHLEECRRLRPIVLIACVFGLMD